MRLWLALTWMAVLCAAAWTYARIPGNREVAVFDTNPPTPYFHYSPTGTSRGRILVVHGLDASKNGMNILCYALADAGFEVFAMDLPGHGDSTAGFTIFGARDAIAQVLDRLGPDTAVLGHSLGGALLLDIAGDRRIPKMVLFSPAPIPLDVVRVDRLLVLEGQFDPGHIRTFATQIRTAAIGSMDYRDMAWTGHSGGLFRPGTIDDVAGWLGGSENSGHSARRLALIATMSGAGLLAAISFLGMLPGQKVKQEGSPRAALIVVYYVGAACAGALILSVVEVGTWLRLYATDYLVSMVLLTGLVLLSRCRPQMQLTLRNVGIALAAAAALIALLQLSTSEVAHFALSGDRWWRFPGILACSVPLFLADEALLRANPLTAFVTRVLIGAIVVMGALILNREAAFLLLLMPAIVVLWIILLMMSHFVRRRTDPVATALFASVVQAWIFSALFVTT